MIIVLFRRSVLKIVGSPNRRRNPYRRRSQRIERGNCLSSHLLNLHALHRSALDAPADRSVCEVIASAQVACSLVAN